MSYEYQFPKSGINKYVAQAINGREDLLNKKILDCPAGDGRTSFLLNKKGADLKSADLFPEFFEPKELNCETVDISKGLPYKDEEFDIVVCQEGIEHFPDQLAVLNEFSRILKVQGELLITTPNISHLRAKLSHFFNESDYYKRSAPSELDGVWFSDKNKQELYFGHVFLINNQKLRTLAIFSGFEIEKIYKTQWGMTSLILFPFLYPFVLLSNLMPFLFYTKKLKNVDAKIRSKVMWEQFRINCSFKTLLCKHTMILFRKKRNSLDTLTYLKSITRKESWN
jgi:SAM-dependent methyltransferase